MMDGWLICWLRWLPKSKRVVVCVYVLAYLNFGRAASVSYSCRLSTNTSARRELFAGVTAQCSWPCSAGVRGRVALSAAPPRRQKPTTGVI